MTAKAVAASATPVTAGTVLTYTLMFENQGKAAALVDHEDVLTRVLDDAVLTGGPTSSDPALTLSPVTDRFTITGRLAAGQKVSVSYQVTVKDAAQRGDHSADNFLVPTGQTPPQECLPGDANCTSTGIPLIQMTKTSDPATGSAVAAGQQVTYTLTFRNAGQGVGPVDFTDDLAAVLDDATLTTAPAASDPALRTTDGADGRVRITGELTGGQTVTVTYTVTVKPDGERGDNRLTNVVAPTGTTDPECGVGATVCTEHPVPELVTWKTSDPASGATVRADGVITYTLHFENKGKADAVVDHDDVLAAVLDDAEVTAAPTATGGLSVTAIAQGRFHASGTLAPGASATVSYQVKVLADDARGDDRMDNFLVPAGVTPPAECAPGADDCTVHHVGRLTVTKSSDPASGSEVAPGDTITYTLTFANGSPNGAGAAMPVDYTDHLARVLDDATWQGTPTASAGLTAELRGDTLVVTGSVPPGGTATVSYAVVIKAYPEQGDHDLLNVVAPTGQEPACVPGSQLCTEHTVPPVTPPEPTVPPVTPTPTPTPTVPVSPSAPPSPTVPPVTPTGPGVLPQTGTTVTPALVVGALALLTAGGVLLLVGRRRQH